MRRQIRYKIEKKETFEPLTEYADDPSRFCKEILGVELWEVQKQIAESVRDHQRTSVCACYASGKCLLSTERIALADGRVLEAGELVGRFFGIPTFDPETGSQAPGLAFAEDNGMVPVYQLESCQGRRLTRTGNHPLWVADYAKARSGVYPENPRWLAMEEIVPGAHLVAIPYQQQVEGGRPQNPDHVKLLGYLLGDGGTTVGIHFSQQPGPALDEFRQIVERLGCSLVQSPSQTIDYRVIGSDPDRPSKGRGFCRTQVNPIKELAVEWGICKKAVDKSFPAWAWELPNDQLAMMLNRLFACDGYAYAPSCTVGPRGKGQRGRVGITLASEKMIRDVELATLRLGIHGRLRERAIKYQETRRRAWEWVADEPDQVRLFAKIVGIVGKQEKLERIIADITPPESERTIRKWRQRAAPPGFYWDHVKTVESLGPAQTVAIAVPGQQAYTTTFAEHNTYLSAALVLWWLYTRRPALAVTTAPTGRQVRKLLWRDIRKLHRRAKRRLPGKVLTTEVQIAEDVLGMGFSSDKPNSVAGLHEAKNVLFVEDEAAGMAAEVVDGFEGITAGGHDSRHLKIGNPLAISGPFWDSHNAPGELTRWNKFSISALDTPNYIAGKMVVPGLVSREWVEDKRSRWGENSPLWVTKVLGKFFTASGEKVIPRDWVEMAWKRWNEELPTATNVPRRLAADIAGGGQDETVLALRDGRRITIIEAWQDADLMRQARKILERAIALNVEELAIDRTGLGQGVCDRIIELQETGIGQQISMIPVCLNASATDQEQFAYLVDEVQFLMRAAFDPAGPEPVAIDPKETDLLRELSERGWGINERGKIKVESKRELTRRKVDSPDRADAVSLLFAPDGNLRVFIL